MESIPDLFKFLDWLNRIKHDSIPAKHISVRFVICMEETLMMIYESNGENLKYIVNKGHVTQPYNLNGACNLEINGLNIQSINLNIVME